MSHLPASKLLLSCALALIIVCGLPAASVASSTKEVEQLDFANGLLERKFYSMALAEYKKFIKQHPKSKLLNEAYFGIAEVYFLEEKYTKAKNALVDYKNRFPSKLKGGVVNLRLAQSHFFRDKFQEALSQLAVIEMEKNDHEVVVTAKFYSGLINQKLENNKEAVVFFKSVSEIAKNNKYRAQSFLEIGNIYASRQKFDQANLNYEKSIKHSQTDKIKAIALYKQGDINFRQDNYDLAIKKFKRVLKDYSAEEIAVDALGYLILTHFQKEDFEKSIRVFEDHKDKIKDPSKHIDVFLLVADAYNRLRQTDRAEELLNDDALKKNASDEEKSKIILKKTEVFIHAQKYRKALEFLKKKKNQLKGNKDQYLFLKAEALYAREEHNEALGHYQEIVNNHSQSKYFESSLLGLAYTLKALGKEKKAFNKFQEFAEGNFKKGNRLKAQYNALMIATERNDHVNAIQIAESFLNRYRHAEQRESVTFLLGTLYGKNKQYEEAQNQFYAFREKYPKSKRHDEALFYQAYNLQLAQKYDEAISLYGQISETDVNKGLIVSALKNRALIYVTTEDHQDAADTFNRLITEFDDSNLDGEIYFWLAKRFLDEKEFNKAIDIIVKADQKQWNADDQAGLNYFRAESHRELKEFDKSIEFYDYVIESEDTNVYVGASYIGKALSLKAMGNYEAASAGLLSALEEYSDDNTISMKARFELGHCAQLKGNDQEATKYYLLVALLYDDVEYVPKALLQSGELFEKLGEKDQALRVYSEMIDRFGEHPLSKTAEERIKTINAG